MKVVTKITLVMVFIIMLVSPVVLFYGMKISPLSWKLLDPVNHSSGLALQGYDAVAFFNDGKTIKGDPAKGLKWNNTIWYFSSEANKLMFKTFPGKYIPQYGGYCASAVATGFTADVDPEIWHIENNRLYLFFSDSSRTDFVANIRNGIINKADTKWSNR